MTLEPWHWFLLGIALMLIELAIATFTVFWFGIAAIMVAILLWIFPWMSTTLQIVMWTIFSVLCTLFWFKYIQPLSKKPTLAAKKNAIGQIGMVIETHLSNNKIKVRFTTPVLGQDEWVCAIDENVQVGDRIQISHIESNKISIKQYLPKD